MSKKYENEFEEMEEIENLERTEEVENVENTPLENEFPEENTPRNEKINIIPGWAFYIISIIIGGMIGIYWTNKNLPELLDGAEMAQAPEINMMAVYGFGIGAAVVGAIIGAGVSYLIIKLLSRALWDLELRQGALIQGITISGGVVTLASALILLTGFENPIVLKIIEAIITLAVFFFVIKKYEDTEKAKLTTITRLILAVLSIIFTLVSTSFLSVPGL